jgi:hypothetical protein
MHIITISILSLDLPESTRTCQDSRKREVSALAINTKIECGMGQEIRLTKMYTSMNLEFDDLFLVTAPPRLCF